MIQEVKDKANKEDVNEIEGKTNLTNFKKF
jgi:hypothetical protein